MHILIINAPHPSIGSRIPKEQLPPLGLLAIGGPLIDSGHEVKLLDAEFGPMSTKTILAEINNFSPDAILMGHSGSTSAHPAIAGITYAIRQLFPKICLIYGGVFPTYHWHEILTDEQQIDIIIRGEGELTTQILIQALENNTPLNKITGIAYRKNGIPVTTDDTPLISNLDDYRIAWELIDFKRYSYWGNQRAVVVQFSRGCPHCCTYCGQQLFWKKWRHRDPKRFAAELAWLYREHGVKVINFADENPTADSQAWKAFLEALIKENVPLILVGSTRADNIVRDADILYMYKKAGVIRFLLGIESYDDKTLKAIGKGTTTKTDQQAIQLLRQHDIISMATYVVGFEEETHLSYWQSLKQLLLYDPDQIQLLYATPHGWTPAYKDLSARQIIQPDKQYWDYKHQVLETKNIPPWLVLIWVKLIEATMQLRPKALWRVFTHRDKGFRAAMRWYYSIGRKVWPYEILRFLFHEKRL